MDQKSPVVHCLAKCFLFVVLSSSPSEAPLTAMLPSPPPHPQQVSKGRITLEQQAYTIYWKDTNCRGPRGAVCIASPWTTGFISGKRLGRVLQGRQNGVNDASGVLPQRSARVQEGGAVLYPVYHPNLLSPRKQSSIYPRVIGDALCPYVWSVRPGNS